MLAVEQRIERTDSSPFAHLVSSVHACSHERQFSCRGDACIKLPYDVFLVLRVSPRGSRSSRYRLPTFSPAAYELPILHFLSSLPPSPALISRGRDGVNPPHRARLPRRPSPFRLGRAGAWFGCYSAYCWRPRGSLFGIVRIGLAWRSGGEGGVGGRNESLVQEGDWADPHGVK